MQVLNVQADGFCVPQKTAEGVFLPDNVVIVINDKNKKIYLWKGSNAGVRKKFVGARAAQKFRFEDMAYTTQPIDQGDASENEKELMKFLKTEKITQPVQIKKRPLRRGVEKPKPTPAITTPLKTPSQPTPQEEAPRELPAAAPELPIPTSTLTAPEISTVPDMGIIDARPVLERAEDVLSEDVLEMLEKMEIPTGFNREVVVVGQSMFTLVETKRTMFGKKIQKAELKKMDAPPDGVYFSVGTTPRIHIREGKVQFAEFLKQMTDEIPDSVQKNIDLLSQVLSKLETKKIEKSEQDIGRPLSDLVKSD